MNSTINRPVYGCNENTDCTEGLESASENSYQQIKCFNKNYEPYQSVITKVFASSLGRPIWYCTCENNICKGNYIEKEEDCAKINNHIIKDDCLILSPTNISACKEVSSTQLRDRCYEKTKLQATQDICEIVTNINLKKECLAISSKNYSICNEISDKGRYDYDCYVAMAFLLKNSTICKNIDTRHIVSRDSCYLNAAISTKDISICNKYLKPDLKEDCIKTVNEGKYIS